MGCKSSEARMACASGMGSPLCYNIKILLYRYIPVKELLAVFSEEKIAS
jgi:hypothetical protein